MAITRMVPDRYDMVDGKYMKVQDKYLETIAVGRVFEVGSKTVQIMSDIWGTALYARYWDDVANAPAYLEYNVEDMGWQYGSEVHAEVDITAEAKEALFNYEVKKLHEQLVGSAEQEAVRIRKGAIAEVVRGRNGKGAKGKVVVVMTAPYRMGYKAAMMEKYGIATSDVTFKKALSNGKVVDAHQDMVWAWAKNCRRVDRDPVDKEALLIEATERVKRSLKV